MTNPIAGWRSSQNRLPAESVKLVTWSRVHSAGSNYEGTTPFFVAILECDSGKRFSAQLADVTAEADLERGMLCQPTYRRYTTAGATGYLHYDYKYKPVSKNS